MRADGYVVIYPWHGERHRDGQVFKLLEHARTRAAEFRADGWRAWVEEL